MIVKVLIGCERSGVVRDAFRALGHDAISCDIEPSDAPGPHYEGDVMDMINGRAGEIFCHCKWDLAIFHPPCTHLAVSGARWFKEKEELQNEAIIFFFELVNANIQRIAIENPVGIMSTLYRKPDQYIQPWEYGHGETKKTCLWLKNLPLLNPTNIVEGREARVHKMPPSEHRAQDRARTYDGWSAAMAAQWGDVK